MNLKNYVLITTICVSGPALQLCGQSQYKIAPSPQVSIKLSGTSAFHRWEMHTNDFKGKAQFVFDPTLVSLDSLSFRLPVQNLKSGKKKLDKSAYKALKTDVHKNIIYRLTSSQVMDEKDEKYYIRTWGNLTVAGITKEIAMNVLCTVNPDASITCTGSEDLKMTDYQVEPPKFMGTLNSGDDVTLDFTIIYKK
jgi:polyisoprenoid-binding protein YceI